MIDINELRMVTQDFKLAGSPMFLQTTQMNELLDRLEAAEKERDFAKTEIARLHDDIRELTDVRVLDEEDRDRIVAWRQMRCPLYALPVWGSQAVLDVTAERRRQIEVEGWTPEHDDEHSAHALAEAAACYCLSSAGKPFDYFETVWPWERWWFKASGTRRDLVKAGALLLAEVERLDRAAEVGRKMK